jgi:hypothetical protein
MAINEMKYGESVANDVMKGSGISSENENGVA